jgi:hypothetical protein
LDWLPGGLLSLERIAEHAEKLIGIEIELYGFDTGYGMPKPQDYRDCPNLWLDGQFPMDKEALKARFRCASLQLGRGEGHGSSVLGETACPGCVRFY